jgi:hypothetical protein
MPYIQKVPANRVEPMAWLGKTNWLTPTNRGYRWSKANIQAILDRSLSLGRGFAEEVREIINLAAFEFTVSGPRPSSRTEYSDIYFMASKVLATGQKTIQLSQAWCEAFENTSLTLRFQDYRQPFPTMVVEFPANYAEARFVPGEGEYPEFVAVHHEESEHTLLFEIVFRTGQMTTLVPFRLEDEIETILDPKKMFALPLDHIGFEARGSEASLVPFLRIAMNAMIAMIYGSDWHKLDPTPTDRANQKRLKTRRRTAKQADAMKARLRLAMLPEYYQFSQTVKAFEEQQHSSQELTEHDGTHKKSHWRRGHWRQQAVGTGRNERKLVWIRPTLVNAGLFKGDPKDTAITYTT